MPRLSRTAQAVLGFLTWEPMSGYDVKKAVDASIRNFWNESYGQIYPILRRLEAEGLAAVRKEQRGSRERREYAITEAGRAALQRWLREPTPPSPPRIEALLKLFFGAQTDAATNLRQVEDHRRQQLDRIARYEAIGEAVRAEHAGHPDLPYWLMTVRYGVREARAVVEWCDETLEELRALARERNGEER